MAPSEGPRESGHISEVVALMSFLDMRMAELFNTWSERVMVEWTECK